LTVDCAYEKLSSISKELELMQRIVEAHFPLLKYVTMGVIIGTPTHTKEKLEGNFMRNIEKFLQVFSGLPLEVAMTVFNFMPLPGAKYGEEAYGSGRIVVTDPFYADPEVINFGITSYAPAGMTPSEVFVLHQQALNLNPAGKDLGIAYTQLQQLGEKAFSENERWRIPAKWKIPGYHLREKVR
jgi:hypothetical protein